MKKHTISLTIAGEDCKKAVVDDQTVDNYWVDVNGNIWSTKQNNPKKLRSKVSGKNPYPAVMMMINGKAKTVSVHRVVCSTYHRFDRPKEISKKDWDSSSDGIKNLVKSLCQVNHIDHDHMNFHPSNLEWVTVKQNSQKYQIHRTNGL